MLYKFSGAKLKELRKQTGESMFRFGIRFGLNPTSIGAYEKEEYEPHIATMLKILDEFKLPLTYFFVPVKESPKQPKK